MNERRAFRELQLAQQEHDEKSHRDILNMPLAPRMKHLTLHFAKYTGRCFEPGISADRTKRLVIDSAVIALTSANALNVRLDSAASVGGLLAAKDAIAVGVEAREFAEVFGSLLARHAGEMAKACESLDHLEAFPFRETLERNTTAIAELCIGAATVMKLDLERSIRERWSQVEQKSVFALTDESSTRLVKAS